MIPAGGSFWLLGTRRGGPAAVSGKNSARASNTSPLESICGETDDACAIELPPTALLCVECAHFQLLAGPDPSGGSIHRPTPDPCQVGDASGRWARPRTCALLTGLIFLLACCAVVLERGGIVFTPVLHPAPRVFRDQINTSVEERILIAKIHTLKSEERKIRTQARMLKNHLQRMRLGQNANATKLSHQDVRQLGRWSITSYCWAAFVLLCLAVPGCCCCVACTTYDRGGFINERDELLDCQNCGMGLPDFSDCQESEGGFLDADTLRDGKISRILRREMRYALFYPLLPALAASQATCEEGVPLLVYIVFFPVLMRAQLVEWQLLRSFGLTRWDIMFSTGFVLGALDKLDWMTDGMFPVQAYKCDAHITPLFAKAFDESWAPSLAPLILKLHFWGIAYFVLFLGTASQHFLAVYNNHPVTSGCMSAADVAGFGATCEYYENKGSEHDFAIDRNLMVFARVILENVLQLHLQASFFALTFDQVEFWGKCKLCGSLVLGLFGAVVRAKAGAIGAWQADDCATRFWCISPLIALLLTAWAAAKILFVFLCDSHLWNLNSGCVRI